MLKAIEISLIICMVGLFSACGGSELSATSSSSTPSMANPSFSSAPSSVSSSIASSVSDSSSLPNPVGNAQNGASIYTAQCQVCHGDNGEGVGPFPSLLGAQCASCGSMDILIDKISTTMPNTLTPCNGSCALDVSTFIMEAFAEQEQEPAVACSGPDRQKPRALPLKRLSKYEYANTLKDLFGFSMNKAKQLSAQLPDETPGGFDNDATNLIVSELHVERFEKVARDIASEAVNELDELVGCDTGATATGIPSINGSGDQCNFTEDCQRRWNMATDCRNSASPQSICMCGAQRCDASSTAVSINNLPPRALNQCAKDFVRDFGKKVFRRPLTSREKAKMEMIYDYGKDNIDFKSGIQLVVEQMLQMPAFLYRPEFGDGSTLVDGVVKLNSWEIASRLSYMFTASMPDNQLFSEAEQDKLKTKNQIRAQAERLLEKAQAKQVVQRYFQQWMGLSKVKNIGRNASDYPGWNNDIPGLLLRETKAFVNHIFWDLDAGLDEFLTADYTFANTDLARYYSASDPGPSFAKISVPNRNFGLLSQGGFLASHARPEETSPVMRGVFLLEKVLCFEVPPPDPDADVTPPPANDPNASTRERIARKTEVSGCINCHLFINPAGFYFEHFDASGRWREQDNGLVIDDSGELTVTDIRGLHTGLGDLSRALASSEDVSKCAVKHWASYTMGREFNEEDYCNLQQAYETFKEDGESLKKLLITLTQNDAFLYRPVVRQ